MVSFLIHYLSNVAGPRVTPPRESQALRERNMARNPKSYEDDYWGTPSTYEPPEIFRGSRLAISINGVPYGDVWYPTALQELHKEDPHVKVSIVGPTDADSAPALADFAWEDPPGSTHFNIDFYPVPHGEIYWEFDEAEGHFGDITIKQVRDDSVPPGLKVVESREIDEALWTPSDGSITSRNSPPTIAPSWAAT